MKNVLIVLFTFIMQAALGQIKLRINPDGAESTKFSELFEEVKFIPLETKSESLFGSIKQLFVTKDLFIFTETSSNNIMIFYKNGKFKTKILRDTYSNGRIYVDYDEKSIHYSKGHTRYSFNYDGKQLDSDEEVIVGEKYLLGSNNKIYYDKRVYKGLPDSISHEITLYNNGKIYSQLFPYNMKLDDFLPQDAFHTLHYFFYSNSNGKNVLFTRPYNYNIYAATSSNVDSIYQMILPYAKSIESDVLNDNDRYPVGTKFKYLADNPDRIQSVTFPYLLSNNLFFKLQPFNVIKNSYLYRLDTETLYRIDDIQPDEKSHFLDVLNITNPSEFINKNFLVADDDYIYTIIPAIVLKDQYKTNKGLEVDVEYPEDLLMLLKSRNSKDNYVIVALKPYK